MIQPANIGLWMVIVLLLVSCTATKQAGRSAKQDHLSQEERLQVSATFIDAKTQQLLENTEAAEKLFRQCLDKDARHDAALYELAHIRLGRGESREAMELARQAAAIDPENIWYNVLIIKIHQQNGRYLEAATVYEKLVRLQPDNIEFYNQWAAMFLFAGKFSDALDIYNKIEQRIGVSEEVSLKKEQIYINIKKPLKAIEELEKLIAAFPDVVEYYSMVADLYLKTNQMDKAKKAYDKIKEIDPDNEYLALALSDYYRMLGNDEDAYEEMKKAYANPLLDIDTKVSILISYLQFVGQPDKKHLNDRALELVRILIDTHPESAKAWSIMGDFLYNDKQSAAARDAFRKVVELDDSKYVVWEQLLVIESELEDYPAMVEESERALALFPEQPLLYLFRGIGLSRLKAYAEAVEAFLDGATITVSNKALQVQFYTYLGDTYYQMDSIGLSDQAYEQVLDFDPNNAYVLNNYSYYLSERGERLEEAADMAKKANELNPDDDAYLDTYGWVLYKQGKYLEAKAWIWKSIQFGGDKSAVILEHYGDILYKLGHPEESLEYWKRAKETGEGSKLLEKKINDQKLYE